MPIICAATLRLSHQKDVAQTSKKTGVIMTEVRAIVIHARMEYTLSAKDLMSPDFMLENTNYASTVVMIFC